MAGPRQVGKATLVRQALERLQRDAQENANTPFAQHSASADGPGLQGQVWLGTQWQVARARGHPGLGPAAHGPRAKARALTPRV